MGKIILTLLLCSAVLGTISTPFALADEPHENPDIAKTIFSGISLFKYYSSSLDFVLQRNPTTVKESLDKMPFANIPPELGTATGNFTTSGEGVSSLVVDVYEGNLELQTLIKEFLLKEAVTQANWVYARIIEARGECDRLEQAVITDGDYFKISFPKAGIDLKNSYQEVLDKINQIRQMLILFEEILKSSPVTAEPLSPTGNPLGTLLPNSTGNPNEPGTWSPTGLPIQLNQLKPTEITLNVDPSSAYVGDDIHFSGLVTSGNELLGGREVNITFNGSQVITVTTDSAGYYEGTLQVPYRYIHELDVQAIYYPKGQDIGIYLASISPMIKVEVLFYEATLKLELDKNAYPGLETTIKGSFDYGQSPVLQNRNVEIYLDDVLVSTVSVQETFSQNIKLDPQTEEGKHNITVSAAASGRYASVVASAILNVTKATPILDLNLPKIAIIPGKVSLTGTLHSELGPLSGASVRIELGKSQVETASSEGGTFQTEIKAGWDFSFIGSQGLTITVSPQEPWNAPLVNTKTIMMVNVINCGSVLVILVLLGIYLPGRLRKRLGDYRRRRVRPTIPKTLPEPSPVYGASIIMPASIEGGTRDTKENGEDNRDPRSTVFYLYRLAVRLIQKMTNTFFKPQQTLREFARENSKVLGPAARYFIELTRIVETLLYSPYKPAEKDVIKSQELSRSIEEESKGEIV